MLVAKRSSAACKGGSRAGGGDTDYLAVQVRQGVQERVETVCRVARKTAQSASIGGVFQQRNGCCYPDYTILQEVQLEADSIQ